MISCGDTSTGPEPDPKITTGTVVIMAATTGDGTDEDGYEVTLNDESKPLEINGSVEFQDIEEGTYNVELNGLGMGCNIDGDNPVSVDVVAGLTTHCKIFYRVDCK